MTGTKKVFLFLYLIHHLYYYIYVDVISQHEDGFKRRWTVDYLTLRAVLQLLKGQVAYLRSGYSLNL